MPTETRIYTVHIIVKSEEPRIVQLASQITDLKSLQDFASALYVLMPKYTLNINRYSNIEVRND